MKNVMLDKNLFVEKNIFNRSIFRRVLATLAYGILSGMGIRLFLHPTGIYSGGVNGLSQLINSISKDYWNVNISIGLLLFLFNIPLMFLSWKKLGHKFTLYTLLAISFASISIDFIPEMRLTDDPLLAAVFGGVLMGTGVGIVLRTGFSTGGTDILILVIQKATHKSVGSLGLMLNGVVVILAGWIYGWQLALYSIITIYASTKMLDYFYIQQYKLTITVYTKKEEEVVKALLARNVRGVTIASHLHGGYTNEELSSVVSVISKHEYLKVRKCINEADPKAFVNVQPTVDVLGRFADNPVIK